MLFSPPKVLIVDDLPADLVALSTLLAKLSVEIMVAKSGAEALAIVLEHEFALILLDVRMPNMDGYEVAEILKGEPDTKDIPIIFLTAALKNEFYRVKGYEAGAVDYLEKPINEDLLRSKVTVFLDLYQQKLTLRQLLHQQTEDSLALKKEIKKRQLVEHQLRNSQDDLENQVVKRTKELSEEIERRKKAQEELKLAAVVFDAASEGIIVTDSNLSIKTVNPAFCKISGYQNDEVIDRNLAFFLNGLHKRDSKSEIWQSVELDGHWNGELWAISKQNQKIALWLSVSASFNEVGKVTQTVMVFTDITQRKIIEDKIHYQAHFDALTNLPNRLLFNDRLKQALLHAKRNKLKLALLFLDLDRFKEVNDALGHTAGDALLVEAGKRIRSCVRESDTVSRIGGDEFTIILGDLRDISHAITLAEELNYCLNEPFSINGSSVFVGSSIGITVFPDDADNAENLISNADMAMYKAKKEGRNTFQFFTKDMTNEAIKRMKLEKDLRQALREEEFILYYQPIIDLHSSSVISVEALIRWNHPQRGIVSPAEFIGIAEETGLIVDLGDWVIEQACKQLSRWNSAKFPTMKLSVNLSSRECQSESYVNRLSDIMQLLELKPSNLMLEITENMVMSERAYLSLQNLVTKGVNISVDDFGTGYSSLGYLQKFQLEAVKIDRSFIQRLLTSSKDRALVESIISMVHQLGLKVIVEGVETREQEDFLRSRNCEMAQGYLYSPPVPFKEVEQLIDSWN